MSRYSKFLLGSARFGAGEVAKVALLYWFALEAMCIRSIAWYRHTEMMKREDAFAISLSAAERVYVRIGSVLG